MIKENGALMFGRFSFASLLIIKCFGMEESFENASEELKVNEESTTIDVSQRSYDAKKAGNQEFLQKNNSDTCCCFSDRCFYIEALPGYYYPLDKRIREIYGKGGFSGQLDVGRFLNRNIAFFLRGGAYWDDGKSTVLRDKTRIILGNITLGLKYVIPIFNRLHYYAGGGGKVFFLRVKNNSDFVQKKVSANKLGGAFVTGFWVYPFKRYRLFFDIFLDYSFYTYRHFKSTIASERNNLDVSGPTVGIGLGYQF